MPEPGRGWARELVGQVGHRAREAALHLDIRRARAHPRVAFLPSSSREGASLLRAHRMAEELRRKGWGTIAVPAQLELDQRRRVIAHHDPDLLVFQQCRHPLNDPAHAFGRPWVLDIDDADFLDPALTDRLARTCAGAAGVVAGSRYVRDWCARHNPNATVIWTGTPMSRGERPSHRDRRRVITWAQSAPVGYEAERHLVKAFCDGLRATDRFVLRLYGVADDAERRFLQEFFGPQQELEMLPTLPYDAFLRSLREAALGLSPLVFQSDFSRGKSFGKILGYLDAKVPVIASDEADHALFFRPGSGVISNDLGLWIGEGRRLLNDPRARDEMAEAGFALLARRLSMEVAARRLGDFLRPLAAAPG